MQAKAKGGGGGGGGGGANAPPERNPVIHTLLV